MRQGFDGGDVPEDGERSAVVAREPFDGFAVLVAIYLSAAMVLGGSSTMLVPAAALELAALPLLAVALIRLAWLGVDRDLVWPLTLAGAVALVPLLQLIPLPHDLWTSLPGRHVVDQSLQTAGRPGLSLPLSLTPTATWAAEFGLWPPLAVFAAVLTLKNGARRALAMCVVLAALASVALSISQKLGGEGRAIFGIIDLSAKAGASGFFANRNHQALFLSAAIPLAGLVTTARWTPAGPMRLATCGGLILVLLIGAIVTNSRAALALAPISVAFAAGIAALQLTRKGNRLLAAAPLVGLAGALALLVALAVVSNLAPLADRFRGGLGEDLRFALFPIVARAGLDFAPAGTGLGSFAAVYQSVEPAGLIGPAFVNHAHNDYLELWLEGGLVAAGLLAAFLTWWALATMRLSSLRSVAQQASGAAGAAVVALILIHSTIDYPARTLAVACVLGFACALLARSGAADAEVRRAGSRRGRLAAAVGTAVVLAPLLAIAGRACLTQSASAYYEAADPARALRWQADNPTALANLAEAEFGRSATDAQARSRAVELARAAIAASPLEGRPYRILALAAEAAGRPAETRALMGAGGHWSRRDELTQVWLMLDDMDRRAFPDAMVHADLVLNQWWQLESVVFPAIQERLHEPEARAAVVGALAASPGWRPGFLRVLAASKEDPAVVQAVYAGLRGTERPPTASETAYLIDRLIAEGDFRQAYEAWGREPGVRATGGLYDGDFRGLPGGAPFNWRFNSANGQSAGPLLLDEGGSALAVSVAPSGEAVLAEQSLILPPGGYVLRGRVRTGSGEGVQDALFEWRLSCLPQAGEALASAVVPAASAEWRDFVVGVQVPEACRAQVLQLRGRAGAGSSDVYFRGLAILPAPPRAGAP